MRRAARMARAHRRRWAALAGVAMGLLLVATLILVVRARHADPWSLVPVHFPTIYAGHRGALFWPQGALAPEGAT